MSKRNRGGGGQQGGGGGGNAQITIKGQVDGVRNNCTLKVKLLKGRDILCGEWLQFQWGTADKPNGSWIMDSKDPNKFLSVKTDSNGEIQLGPLDLSDEKSFPPEQTGQILVVYKRTNPNPPGNVGLYEQGFALPAPETTDKSKAIKKIKRIKVFYEGKELVDGETVSGIKSRYTVRVQTMDDKGKANAESFVFMSNGEKVSYEDDSGAPLKIPGRRSGAGTGNATDVTSYASKTTNKPLAGSLISVIRFKGAKRSISFIHAATSESVTVTFHTK